MKSSSTTTTALERNNVTVSGAGSQAIVFLHGLGSDQSHWRLIVPHFEDRYQVVLLDLVGAGQSDTSAYNHARYGSLAGHADDLLNVMSELALHDAIFVGHSVGSMIGVLAAIREPQRFAKLVLISPSPRFINEKGYMGGFEQKDINELLLAMESNYNGWSEAIAPVMMGDDYPELVMELSNSFMRTNPSIAQHFARVTFFSDTRPDLHFLNTPTLIIQSKHDVIAPLAVGQYLNEQLPDSQLKVIDTKGHCPQLTASQETLAALDKFIQDSYLMHH